MPEIVQRDDEPYLKRLADKIGAGKHFSVGQTHRAVYPKRYAAWVVADKLTAIMQRLVSMMESPVAMGERKPCFTITVGAPVPSMTVRQCLPTS